MTVVFTREYLPIDDPDEIARRRAVADYTIDALTELVG